MNPKCIMCGLCRNNCAVYVATKKETSSPRGKAILKEKELLKEQAYVCTLCGACKEACPLGVDMKLKKFRNDLIREGFETKANKKMIENIREFGNPFGKINKGENPKERYCC